MNKDRKSDRVFVHEVSVANNQFSKQTWPCKMQRMPLCDIICLRSRENAVQITIYGIYIVMLMATVSHVYTICAILLSHLFKIGPYELYLTRIYPTAKYNLCGMIQTHAIFRCCVIIVIMFTVSHCQRRHILSGYVYAPGRRYRYILMSFQENPGMYIQ